MKLNALILRTSRVKESDLIVTMYSREQGKISGLAKHALKSKRRFPGGLEVFDCGQVEIRAGKSGTLLFLETFTLHHTLRNLRMDLDKMTLAGMLSFVLERISKEEAEENSYGTFDLVELSLRSLDQASEKRELCKITCLCLGGILSSAGFIDLPDSFVPGVKSFRKLIGVTQEVIDAPIPQLEEIDKIILGSVRD